LSLAALAVMAASPGRMALWQAVRVCVADYKLTGAPFPCLMVDISGGEDRGYVVLRAPFGPPDTILAPTRKVAGIEDPWLQTPEAPNYFAAAWRERSLFGGKEGEPPPENEFALAVNSALARTQDQLHIHIGCLVPPIRRGLARAARRLPIGLWERVDEVIPGSALWALRTGQSNLDGINPFRLAAQGLAGTIGSMARISLIVTQLRDPREFMILASDRGLGGQLAAEDVLDLSCSTQSAPSKAN